MTQDWTIKAIFEVLEQKNPKDTIALVFRYPWDATQDSFNLEDAFYALRKELAGTPWSNTPLIMMPDNTSLQMAKLSTEVNEFLLQLQEKAEPAPQLTPAEAQLQAIVEKHVEKWCKAHYAFRGPLDVRVAELKDGWSITISDGEPTATNRAQQKTHVDLEVKSEVKREYNASLQPPCFDTVMYLNSICLAKELRGKGHGSALYEMCVDIARDLYCQRIEQTASGFAVREIVEGVEERESRWGWLRRRGWKGDGPVQWKELEGPDSANSKEDNVVPWTNGSEGVEVID